MMRLHKAASHFDDSLLYDAYTGTYVGKGQLDPTDIYKLDGASVLRRVISISPDTILPARLAIRLGNDAYLIGSPSTDEWNGSPIRTKYTIHQTPSTATVKTVTEALLNEPGRTMYASREWNKDVPDQPASSTYFNDYHIFVSHTEPMNSFDLIFIDDQWHIIHAVHPSLSGFTDAVSHEIIGRGFDRATFRSKAYNPILDSYVDNFASINTLRVRWQEQFKYLQASQETYVRGDESVFAIPSEGISFKPSDTLEYYDGRFRILAVQDLAGTMGQTKVLHIRRD